MKPATENRNLSMLEFVLAVAFTGLSSLTLLLLFQIHELRNQSSWFEPVMKKVAAERDMEAQKRLVIEKQCNLHTI